MTIIDKEDAELQKYEKEDPYGNETDQIQVKPKVHKAKLIVDKEELAKPIEPEQEEMMMAKPKDEVIDATQFSEMERLIYEKIRKQEMLDEDGVIDDDYYDEDEFVDKYGVSRV